MPRIGGLKSTVRAGFSRRYGSRPLAPVVGIISFPPMTPLQATILPAMGAVFGGLLLFAGALLAGLAIIRRMRLPQDLPEGPRFEPPPPDIREPTDHATAEATARERNQLREHLARAHAAVSDGLACQEVLVQLESFPGKDDPANAAAIADLRAAAAIAIAAGSEADRIAAVLRHAPGDPAPAEPLTGLAIKAATARAAVDTACERLPDGGGNRRLVVMLVLLVVMVAWLMAMRWLLPK